VVVSVPEQGKGEVLVVVGEPGKPSQVVQAGTPVGPAAGSLSVAPGRVVEPAVKSEPLRIGAVEAEGDRLFVQGTGPAGAKTVIYLNDAPLAEAQIGADGRWSLTVAKGLGAGNYKIRVDQTGADGKVVARAEVPFVASAEAASPAATASVPASAAAPKVAAADARPAAPDTIQTSAPEQPVQAPASPPATAASSTETAAASANPVVAELQTVEVRRGDNLWQISRRIYGQGIRYSTIYEANTDQIRDPDRIYPGQIFVMPGG
jgi:nucleoid-associated protein YgaU